MFGPEELALVMSLCDNEMARVSKLELLGAGIGLEYKVAVMNLGFAAKGERDRQLEEEKKES